ncbi:hypothetical protein PIB30_046156 [Stylosanthes scabra]|uniref:Uncharacterized protein n=1 Tax=Stylosanthes scabra TaxID=79078 RepID=A0ABU6UGX6_9FABA|nr:hypothetical protein [Stylosanthes scabra]
MQKEHDASRRRNSGAPPEMLKQTQESQAGEAPSKGRSCECKDYIAADNHSRCRATLPPSPSFYGSVCPIAHSSQTHPSPSSPR